MVKIAAFPKCWLEDIVSRKMDLFDWISQSVELEVDGLEMYYEFLLSYDESYLQKVRKSVEELGMTIPMMCFSSDFTTLDKDEYEIQIKKQKEMIRVTAALGGQYCRVLSGQKRPEIDEDTGCDLVVNAIEQCLPTAEEYNVRMVMENHYKDGYWSYVEFAQKAHVFTRIVNSISSPFFGVQFDPSNSYVAGDDVLGVMDSVLPRIMTMHASDRYLVHGANLEDIITHDGLIGYPDKLIHGVTGEGVNNYPEIFKRLKKINFNGWISIEDGMNGMAEMKKSVDFLKFMREKYL